LPAPRVIIVDDQRDISRMLRAALETLGGGYVIVDVPSAEEAQLEFRRGPVDLLITDLRLPGISGLELIRRLHKASSEARMIVISAYADETAQAEFRHLGATFFPKPLDLPAFLKGVREAVGAREEARGREPAGPTDSRPDNVQPDIASRLVRLQRDLSALSAFLMHANGRIVVQAGEAAHLDLDALLPRLVDAFRASLRVSQLLGGQAPANVHFFYGSTYEVYSANVGASFTLVIVFDGQHGVGQMGPVLRYGRLAADDLLNTLRKLGVEGGQFRSAAPAAPQPARKVKTGPLQKKKKTGPLPPPALAAPLTPAASPAKSQPVSPEALQALDTAAEKTKRQDASKFWEDVDGAEIGDARAGTLSWEEAAKLGLVPPKTPTEK
jgi:DNA-binding response OmpR family regulator